MLAAIILLVAACGSGGRSSSTTLPTTTPAHPASAPVAWTLSGADLQNSWDVDGAINASNVSTLGVAWTVPITAHAAFGAYATTPVVANGIAYMQDLASNVQAINLASSKVMRKHKYNSPNEGPNGVTFAAGDLYGAPNRTAFALNALASRMPVPVENAVAVGQLPAAVETSAYFVVAEPLTNVAKHARARRATVTARVEDSILQVRVGDDDVGGCPTDGSGLLGVADRLAVLDGQLRVESPADGGTLVAADIPVPD